MTCCRYGEVGIKYTLILICCLCGRINLIKENVNIKVVYKVVPLVQVLKRRQRRPFVLGRRSIRD